MASKMMHSLLLVGFGASSTFAYPTYLLQASNCARSLTPGTQIMGNSAASDSSQSMSVTDSNRQSASSVEAGGSVSVSFSVSGNQHVIETSLGTFSSGTRGCGNQRTTSSSTTLSVPAREKEIGGSGGSLEPPGPLITHLHTVFIWRILSAFLPA